MIHIAMQTHLDLYKSYLQNRADNSINTNPVLAAIAEDEITSAAAFDLFCQSIPNFDIKTCGVKRGVANAAHFGQTCLHLAVIKRNADLVQHFISRFGKEVLFQNNSSNFSILLTAMQHLSAQVLKPLIAGGANVNTPYFEALPSIPLLIVYTPLQDALQLQTDEAAKMLLQAGAEEACRITADGVQLLQDAKSRPNHLRINYNGQRYRAIILAENNQSFVARTTHRERALKKKLRAEIHTAAFQFFLGLSDSFSSIAALPKKLVIKILKESKPSNTIRKKARKLIEEARYAICKNEMLFLCAMQDMSSAIAGLNRDAIFSIFKSRIQLEMNFVA